MLSFLRWKLEIRTQVFVFVWALCRTLPSPSRELFETPKVWTLIFTVPVRPSFSPVRSHNPRRWSNLPKVTQHQRQGGGAFPTLSALLTHVQTDKDTQNWDKNVTIPHFVSISWIYYTTHFKGFIKKRKLIESWERWCASTIPHSRNSWNRNATSLRSAWATQWVPGQPRSLIRTISPKKARKCLVFKFYIFLKRLFYFTQFFLLVLHFRF